ncbi:MAG: PDDEXK nuclease domain-containing protein [Propionibacteriaceae bacterium]|jgi:predicted nuclease of restriction endonuclease-like (RecB) superfamily|nr:PDDEXK nuclease domain-containing protein [Propionibacteriaceae bacterium]
MPLGYAEWIADVKARVRATQLRAARAANREVIRLYWSIGRDILTRQERLGWGAKVIQQAASDLRAEFPGQRGWSPTNLKYMRMLAVAWPDLDSIGPQAVDQLPWGHVRGLIDRLSTREERDWYAARSLAEGWSRNVLEHFIKVGLRTQLGAAPTNFGAVLPPPDSDLAQLLVKDPYVFEHLAMVDEVKERRVEQALMDRLQDTLMEFGRGMAFVGRQYPLIVADEHGDTDEFAVDLLLFHIPQGRYVVVELKTGKFRPAYLGQLGTYVAIVDGQMRDPQRHAPTIGLLLCTGKNEATVRFALASTSSPIGVADYEGLPADARAALPSVDELQAVIAEEQMVLRERGGDGEEEKDG